MTPTSLAPALTDLDAQGLRRRRRVLETPQGVHIRVDGADTLSFSSNDYLGLCNHPALAAAAHAAIDQAGTGAGAAHLLTGHHALHHQAEQDLAAFVGLPAALLFSTGYMASLGVIPALLDRHGEVFEDRLNHASLVDAALLSRAKLTRYPHNDLAALERQLAASTAKTKLIASDTVFSMDGDLAPLAGLLDLAERYDAWLYLDDAHGFGVLGETGRGALHHPPFPKGGRGDSSLLDTAQPPQESPPTPSFDRLRTGLWKRGEDREKERVEPLPPRLIYLATLGKTAGVAGAFVAGSAELIEWLVNKARTYIYTTAQPPLLASAVSASLRVIAAEGWRRTHLHALIAQLKAGAANLPWPLMPSDTPIQPLLVGGNHDTLRLAEGLKQRGILIPAIRPPTVPEGAARLRISLSAAHSEADVDRLLTALRELARG